MLKGNREKAQSPSTMAICPMVGIVKTFITYKNLIDSIFIFYGF